MGSQLPKLHALLFLQNLYVDVGEEVSVVS